MYSKLLVLKEKLKNDYEIKNSKKVLVNTKSAIFASLVIICLYSILLAILIFLKIALFGNSGLSVSLLSAFIMALLISINLYILFQTLSEHKKKHSLKFSVIRISLYESLKMYSILSMTFAFVFFYIYLGAVPLWYVYILLIFGMLSAIFYAFLFTSKSLSVKSFGGLIGHSMVYSLLFTILHYAVYIQDPSIKFLITLLMLLPVYLLLFLVYKKRTDVYTTIETRFVLLILLAILAFFMQKSSNILPFFYGDSIDESIVNTANIEIQLVSQYDYSNTFLKIHHDKNIIVFKHRDEDNDFQVYDFYDGDYNYIDSIEVQVGAELVVTEDRIVIVTHEEDNNTYDLDFYDIYFNYIQSKEYFLGTGFDVRDIVIIGDDFYFCKNYYYKDYFKAVENETPIPFNSEDFQINEILHSETYYHLLNTEEGLVRKDTLDLGRSGAVPYVYDDYVIEVGSQYTYILNIDNYYNDDYSNATIMDSSKLRDQRIIGIIQENGMFSLLTYYRFTRQGIYEYSMIPVLGPIKSFSIQTEHSLKVIDNEIIITIRSYMWDNYLKYYIGSIDIEDPSKVSFIDTRDYDYYSFIGNDNVREYDDIKLFKISPIVSSLYAITVICGLLLSAIPPITIINNKITYY